VLKLSRVLSALVSAPASRGQPDRHVQIGHTTQALPGLAEAGLEAGLVDPHSPGQPELGDLHRC